jgi:hypothetical protein
MTIQLRRDTAANWASANPVLSSGQPGYDTTNNELRIGDGVATWSALTAIGAAGVTDHGALTGLADDDHTQYHNNTRGDARYYTKTLLDAGQLDTRYFTESEVTAGFQPLATVLTNTTAAFTTAQETKLSGIAAGAEVNVNADWNSVAGDSQILNKPSTFTPSAHTHVLADVTNVTMTVANLNSLDDGVNSTLHFHDSDRARANHTGAQTASTISDFSTAADARITAATGVSIQAYDAGLASLAAASATDSLYYRSAANTWSPVTIGANITFSGGTLSASGGGGGGSVTSGTSTVAFGATATNEAQLVVTGQTGILAGSKVTASIGTTATADYTADDHKYMGAIGVHVTTGDVVAGTGFTIFVRSYQKMKGDISINWVY